jgi:AMP phosphorylase
VRVLKRDDPPKDLENKSVFLAGKIFELCKKTKTGEGEKFAREILASGKAFSKFRQIIEAQKGKVPTMKEIESRLGKYSRHILAEKSCKIREIDNKKISILANIAGSPMDKGSGIYLHHHVGESLLKGEKLMTIYSDSESRLNNALELYNKIRPVLC